MQTTTEYWTDFQTHLGHYAAEVKTANACASMKATAAGILESGRPPSEMRKEIESLWARYCQVGMMASRHSPLEQQRLVQLLTEIRRLRGPVWETRKRRSHSDRREQQAVFWSELPFFRGLLLDEIQKSFDISRSFAAVGDYASAARHLEQWTNLNVLATKILAASIVDLRVCVLQDLRNVLEQNVMVTSRMLEVLVMWLEACGGWLEGLTLQQCSAAMDDFPVLPGELAKAAGVAGDGVSALRLRFWRERLLSIVACFETNPGFPDAAQIAGLARRALAFIPQMIEFYPKQEVS